MHKLRGEYGRLNQSLLFILVRDRFAIRISPVFFRLIFTHFETFPACRLGSPFRGASDNV
ncbi:conserved hypothetical protein [Xenorhabdus nematophila F1]|nr:conserved hypothetical protein [Xenorhabdus nematophila F1]